MPRSDVAHYQSLAYWGPVSVEQMEAVLDRMDLRAGARALDIGCGRAEILVRLVERSGVSAVGIDRSAAALALARDAFAERCPEAEPELIERDAASLAYPAGSFDVIAWLGGPYVGTSFETTVETCATWLKPGGYLLLGHGFWAEEPPAAYLEATELPADTLATHEHNLDVVARTGCELVDVSISTRDAWDHFEGTILANHEQYAAANPDEDGVAEMIATKRAWHVAQERWGRDVMGFALYLLRR
ncbi:MAG: methyltransferase domain-containing protein [Planctomycetota bacterium]|nr:methyltransferase domain-containing protein [Planctomycetota bacterium]